MKASFIGAQIAGLAANIHAGETTRAETLEKLAPSVGTRPVWAIEAGTGLLWSNVRDRTIPGYNLIPFELSFSRTIHHACLEGFQGGLFEARPEAVVNLHWTQVEQGVENHLAGFSAGLRYNFVHVSGPVVPFAEASVGAAWADSQPFVSDARAYGLGQDFNFNFNLATGIRCQLAERWFARASLVYQHYSNAGMSEPEHPNRAIDAVGFLVAFGLKL